MSWGSTWGSSVKSWWAASGKGNKRPVTSDQTRKEERQAGCWHYRGKEKAPRGFLGALVGTSMSIARKGGENEKESEEEAEGEVA